jgi:hypothetical protein
LFLKGSSIAFAKEKSMGAMMGGNIFAKGKSYAIIEQIFLIRRLE